MYLGPTSSPEKKFLEKRQNPNFSSADELTSELYAKDEAVVCLVSARFLIKLFAIVVAVVGFASQFWWGSGAVSFIACTFTSKPMQFC